MKRIHTLVKAIAAEPGSAHAHLKAFASSHTFPLMDGDQAVFFFWIDEPVEALYLVHWVFGLESRQPFHRIPTTNAYFLALELPHAARVEYKLELHQGGNARWIRDPHNDRRAFDPFGSNSVCPMPGYTDPAWVHPDPSNRPGAMESFHLESAVFGDTREIKVYLPQEYKASKTYPLLIVHDGDDYLRFAAMRTILDNLIQRHEMRPTVVAFTRGHARNTEYGANPDQPAYLVDELLPALESRYSISDDRAERGLLGASFGGVSSLFCAWERPGVFGRLMLQSGSFVFTDVGDHGRGELWDPVVEFVNAFPAVHRLGMANPGPLRFRLPALHPHGSTDSLTRGAVPLHHPRAPDQHSRVRARHQLRSRGRAGLSHPGTRTRQQGCRDRPASGHPRADSLR